MNLAWFGRTMHCLLALFLVLALGGCHGGAGTDIWAAVEREDLAAIQRYADRGGDLEAGSTIRGKTPLLHALKLEKKESYRKLLELGASPNTMCRGGAVVVHHAAARKDSYWLRLALESGGDANLFNERGYAWARTVPLPFAIHEGTLDNVKLLCEHGADVNAFADEHKRTMLRVAWEAAEFEVAYYLLEQGADYNIPASMYCTFLYGVRRRHPEVYQRDQREWCLAVVEWLVAHGADPDKAVWDGTKWEFAARSKKSSE